ncbi:MAG: UbiD family decarboxylase [Deltaproteobacteria bacterium]|nr:UbiD family decarboxylase [Candidatus Anaeroferrophillus wilburensis]MBN2888949.1 UbiD family decarboxylase [Deltaproteobacteria bacterium]
MGYKNLRECILDLETAGQLIRISNEVDPYLEVGAIQRRVCQAGGPALFFSRVKGCRFPLVGNLFGTLERTRFMFRDTLRDIERLVNLKTAPGKLLKDPGCLLSLPRAAWHLWPRKVARGPILNHRTTVDALPWIQSWPGDGGPFITLPLVYSESPGNPGWQHGNLGMYRVQLAGGRYEPNREVGLHYQLHRGIGVHHAEALERRQPLRVNVFVGGPPALMVAAVMPLPEGMPELAFAGLLGGRQMTMVGRHGQLPMPAEIDFCLQGTVKPGKTLPEGPFGDHLGYYSLAHDFPVLDIERVWHRDGAIWPFTTVGRPPQEDTSFGAFIHQLTGELIADVLPGVKAVNAVDAAGVHPLLLAIGSERYVPYADERQPRELLTQANAILGQGQLSLAKYLLIVAGQDNPGLDIDDIPAFFSHLLARVDWRRDLHFQTRTTIDTLDYSGSGLHEGSKVVVAAAGPCRRELAVEIPTDISLPSGFTDPRICLPGVMAVRGPACTSSLPANQDGDMLRFCQGNDSLVYDFLPLIVVVDDSEFVSRSLSNFLWVTFTRSDPASDIYGIDAVIEAKHWGCGGPLIIDARQKPHHAPPLLDDPAVEKRVDDLGAAGGPLHGII